MAATPTPDRSRGFGYRPQGRSLSIVEDHAGIVRDIYARYLELGNVRLLAEQLDAEGIGSPPRVSGKRHLLAAVQQGPCPEPTLIAALRKAHAMLDRDRGRPVITEAPVSPYDRRILRLAFLAPDLQRDILAGRQPASLNLETLMAREIPLAWSEQRETLGWG